MHLHLDVEKLKKELFYQFTFIRKQNLKAGEFSLLLKLTSMIINKPYQVVQNNCLQQPFLNSQLNM